MNALGDQHGRRNGALAWAGGASLCLIVSLASAPALAVLASLAAPFGDTMRHIMSTVGTSYIGGTVLLCAFVGIVAGTAGVIAALLTGLCEFPFRRLLSFALVLPLAAPAYVIAYAYADLLGPFGAFAALARAMATFELPTIRSLPGAVFVLAMTLYPYAYLTARAAFASRSSAIMETARTLGAAPLNSALRLLLPASRPAIAAGVALIMMETAAEFGVADYFGVPTLSVGIFRTWHSFGDLGAASQLASGLFLFSALLVTFEIAGRRGRSSDAPRIKAAGARFTLRGVEALAAMSFCALLVLLGFLIPVTAIAAKIDAASGAAAVRGLIDALWSSVAIAGAGTVVALAAALALAYADRSSNHPFMKAAIRLATLGYAVPGAVIAIGILSVFSLFGAHAAMYAGPIALIYAYAVRFLTAGYNSASGGLAQIDPGFDAAAKTLGAAPLRILFGIHAPLMRRSILAAATIVFVDIAKELPATLILRDFNFETLATRVYRLAGDERLAEAAPNALLLIAISALPIFFLNNMAERGGMDASNNRRDQDRPA